MSQQKSLEYKKDQRQRSVETLGVSGRGDSVIVAKKPHPVKNTRRGKQ